MRRYSRFKICKTNFHFFFLSTRLGNFNRPKWNILKEKIKLVKKPNKDNSIAPKLPLLSFYIIPSLFRSFKYYSKFTSKKTTIHSNISNRKKINSFIAINVIPKSSSFDFLFYS